MKNEGMPKYLQKVLEEKRTATEPNHAGVMRDKNEKNNS